MNKFKSMEDVAKFIGCDYEALSVELTETLYNDIEDKIEHDSDAYSLAEEALDDAESAGVIDSLVDSYDIDGLHSSDIYQMIPDIHIALFESGRQYEVAQTDDLFGLVSNMLVIALASLVKEYAQEKLSDLLSAKIDELAE